MKHALVDVAKMGKTMRFEILYATENNFLGQAVYPLPLCYLHKDAATALLEVQKEVERGGLSLKVFDGYRPLSVQQVMWNKIQDERYCSNPAVNKGRHTRGTAVDVTLMDKRGVELEMPTPFDEFTERAHSDAPCSPVAKKNREYLKKVMEKQGFSMLPTEWWHFDLNGWQDDQKYPPLDISFQEL